MWDGREYAECAVNVAEYRFGLWFLRCAGHPSYVFATLLGAGQLLDPGNAVGLTVVNAALLAVAALGFHRLMRHVFPSGEHDVDIAILTAAFLLQPALLASVVHTSLDLPVVAGTVWCAALIIERRWWWCAVAGTAMAFSKETGAALYAVLVGCGALWVLARTRGSLFARLRALVPMIPTLLPLVAFVGYLLAYRMVRPGIGAVWAGAATSQSLAEKVLNLGLDRKTRSYLALMFVLNFMWVPTTWLAADTVAGLVRALRHRGRRLVAGADTAAVAFLALAAAATVFALTRFVTVSNVRYVLPVTGLLLAIAYVALVRLGATPTVRRVMLGAYTALLVVSAVRTIDPVSRYLWGTFPFGSHRMLAMTSLTNECCGHGRDQLVYSLEFTRLAALTDEALAALEPDTSTVIGVPREIDWNIIGTLDSATYRRTLRRTGVITHRVLTRPRLPWVVPRPRSVLYLAMPNADDPRAFERLARFYTIGPERRFEQDGYVLSAYPLTIKEHTGP